MSERGAYRRNSMRRYALLALIALVCAPLTVAAGEVSLQGHRGARGLAPENTLVGFARALAIGVHVLELDLVMSADDALMVSHDAMLKPDIVRDAGGHWITEAVSVRSLNAMALRQFDVGRINPMSRYAERFPNQQPVDGARIPSLDDVVDLLESSGASQVRLNIETKLTPSAEATQPSARHFADKLVQVIRRRGIAERVSVQSFDWRTLAHVQAIAPEIETVYLTAEQRWLDNIRRREPGPSPWTAGHDIDDHDGSLARLVHGAGGDTWSPYFRELDSSQVNEAHRLGLKVVVWTVNEAPDMHRLLDLGVDGLITDYPDRARQVFLQRGLRLPRSYQR